MWTICADKVRTRKETCVEDLVAGGGWGEGGRGKKKHSKKNWCCRLGAEKELNAGER
jgi:hypothetical protein